VPDLGHDFHYKLMFDEDFQYQDNSLDLILRFHSDTEQSPFGEELFAPVLFKDNDNTAPLFPLSDGEEISGIVCEEGSEENDLESIQRACDKQEDTLK
jgi:hypothetical protein